MKLIMITMVLLTLAGCAITVAGNGETANGTPVTGRYTQSPGNAQSFNLDVMIVSGNGDTCLARENLPYGMTIWNLPIICADGRTGSITLTADHLNRRDTIIYRLSDGETGRIVFGASSLIVQQ
jgi:hypothetical protein